MVEKEKSKMLLPKHYWEQPTCYMSEEERQNWAGVLHKNFSEKMIENGFKVVSSNYRGKSESSIYRKIELMQADIDTAHATIHDLCGIRFVFETDEEINQVIEWVRKDFFKEKIDNSRFFRIRDFREDEVKNQLGGRSMQPGYKAVHVVCSHKMAIDDKPGIDFMEIQLVTSQQEKINETTREAYEVALRQRLQNNRTNLVD